jgi:hypothetical protein
MAEFFYRNALQHFADAGVLYEELSYWYCNALSSSERAVTHFGPSKVANGMTERLEKEGFLSEDCVRAG